MKGEPLPYSLVGRLQSGANAKLYNTSSTANPTSQVPSVSPFADFLQKAESVQNKQSESVANLKISGHAAMRLRERGIELSKKDWEQIGQGVDRVAAKGGKEALLMYGKNGFLVHVPSRTVITSWSELSNEVITKIDSVVMVPQLDPQGRL
ncbi:hypothetical protein [Alicyclobacillus tolerans]|uniref:Flagellar operon protein n=1 Tax=Alicyclobacillus tolerans TaxID=90970 RepID=A0ABT9LX64_9BACL|nr:hypothetical protein [Alicyclobacillus tengchongensis]MDP9728850.1 flagellar operon protein [Alicyclobacillus tengchongensis]